MNKMSSFLSALATMPHLSSKVLVKTLGKLTLSLTFCLTLVACQKDTSKDSNAEAVAQAQKQEVKNRVEVLYFHGKQRCATCLAIEKNGREAIESHFADEIKSGKVVFKVIDISKPENEALAEKYEIAWSSLIVSAWKDDNETYEDLTDFAFSNARNAPDDFKNEITQKVNQLLE